MNYYGNIGLVVQESLNAVSAGFYAFGAMTDGFYGRMPGKSSFRFLTFEDFGSTVVARDNNFEIGEIPYAGQASVLKSSEALKYERDNGYLQIKHNDLSSSIVLYSSSAELDHFVGLTTYRAHGGSILTPIKTGAPMMKLLAYGYSASWHQAGQILFKSTDDWSESCFGTEYSLMTASKDNGLLNLRHIISDLGNTRISGNTIFGDLLNDGLSTVESAGSLGAAILLTSENISINENHTVVVITGDHSITLPDARHVKRRMYFLVNRTTSPIPVSYYADKNGNQSNSISAHSSILIQSDGNNWYQLF